MDPLTLSTVTTESYGVGSMFLVVALCLCVLAQILGSPMTLNSLITADLSIESASEGYTIPTQATEHTNISTFPSIETEPSPSGNQLLQTSIFHPPQT